MQDQLYEINEEKQHGKIFIQSVIETHDSGRYWMPLRFIEKGKRWETDMQNWGVKIHLPDQHRFDKRNWGSVSLPDTTVIGKTVTRFITALRDPPPNSLLKKPFQYLDGQHTVVLTRAIIDGIKVAGLYEILSFNRPFTAQDLVAASRYRLENYKSS